MSLVNILIVLMVFLSFCAEAKMTTFIGGDGTIKCEIDSGGHFEITEGPCFPNLLFYENEFLCETENSEKLRVSKEVLRVDNYMVKAFGYEYFGTKGSGPGIVDELVVKPTSPVAHLEPVSISFHSSSLGHPTHIEVHMQSAKEPLVEKLSCHSI